jgi:hypothetical protein
MSMIKPRPMPPFVKRSAPKTERKRRGLKQRSTAKAAWHRIYVAVLRAVLSVHPLCVRCGKRKATEGHHPFGQIGALILLFWPFCRPCHNEVENNKKQARADGWILYK